METGLIILIASFTIPIVIAIFIVWRVLGGGSKLKKFADELNIRKANALPRNARIMEADAGVQGGEIRRIIFFKLEILDPIKPYTAEAAWFVDTFAFSKAQPGEVISVKVDRDNPQIVYPDISWAVYTEGYDKSFSVKNLEAR